MKKNRILSAALAGAMALSLAAPAMASETVITATYEEIVIDVEVPADGTARINPYGLPIDFEKEGNNAGKATITGQKIVTTPMSIRNRMGTKLDVNVTTIGKANTGLTFATTAPSASETTKQAYVYLQMKASAATGGDSAAATINNTIIDESAAPTWSTAYNSTNDILIGTTKSTEKKMITLEAATMATDGTFSAYPAGSIALVRLAGDVTKKPDKPWASTDGFTATIAYSFEPNTTVTPSGTVTATLGALSGTLSAAAPATTATSALSFTDSNTTSPVTVASVAWSSDDESIFTVTGTNTTATLTAVAAGTANLTATITGSDGATYTATLSVTVNA